MPFERSIVQHLLVSRVDMQILRREEPGKQFETVRRNEEYRYRMEGRTKIIGGEAIDALA